MMTLIIIIREMMLDIKNVKNVENSIYNKDIKISKEFDVAPEHGAIHRFSVQKRK